MRSTWPGELNCKAILRTLKASMVAYPLCKSTIKSHIFTHHSRQAANLWKSLGTQYEVNSVASLWILTLDKNVSNVKYIFSRVVTSCNAGLPIALLLLLFFWRIYSKYC
jgi:hypothetical protein